MNMPQMAGRDPSDSAVQRKIELAMLDRLGKLHPDWQRVTWKAAAAELGLSSVWQSAQPDAAWKASSDQIVVAECYARIGELKAGHRRKLAMDALKLLAIRRALPHGWNIRFLLVVPEKLTGRLRGKSWFPAALCLAAEMVPVTLLASEEISLGEATALQALGQSRTARPGQDRGK
jgi:hypothetical protein